EAFRVAGEKLTKPATSDKTPKVIVGSGVSVTSENDCCIFIYGANAAADVYGSLTSNGDYATIQGNGNADSAGTSIRIFSGASVKHETNMAMYIPQAGTLTISGGTIEGESGLEVKAGAVDISGGTFKATAGSPSHVPNSDGSSSSGYAFALVDNSSYVPGATVTISGGTFNSPLARLDDDSDQTNNSASISITGGTFSTDPTAYVAAGYDVRTNSGAPVTYTVYRPSTGGGGSTTPVVETPVVVEVPVQGEEATVTVPVAVEGSTAQVAVEQEKLAEILDAGTSTGTVTIDASGLDSQVTSVAIPKETVAAVNEAVQDESNDASGLAVALPAATIEFDAAALDTIYSAAEAAGSEAIAISAQTVDPVTLPEEQKVLLSEDVLVLDLTVTVGDQTVSQFNGSVTVSVPYTPAENVNPEHLQVWFLSDTGELIPVECRYENGKMIFATVHFSSYIVGVFPFTDVAADAYYYNAVLWALTNEITTGTSDTTFGPDLPCTRAQMVSFLWRAYGSPEPTTTETPFTDVSESDYFFKAVLWAVEQGITTGVTDTAFEPDATVSRGQTAAFLYRAAGSPAVTADNPFGDVSQGEYYYDAVLWAVEQGVTTGTSETAFSPALPCTRAQIVTLLYRALV
ncbi:MAG: S-layer homology domain-containing protein, partial [Bacillota bacterium]|nr:S-layer homology domain-containing protein [Bacillota bacterium]